ncbi:MAG TPA: hypothetical protein VJ834_01765 [Burkholderiales bacterium]|nr:hypothetical protein [Burkholderiales bacterium]
MTPMRRHVLGLAIAGAFMVVGGPAALAQQSADQPAAKREPIYGYRMMSPEERDEYRAKMRSTHSAEERQAIRDEHHAAMVERAKERGITLPDRPTGAGPRGPGMGPGEGMGPDGTGPRGPGMGPGPRMGPPDGPRGPGYGPRTQ